MDIMPAEDQRTETLSDIGKGATFKLPKAHEPNTRYMVVEHQRSAHLKDGGTHYLCLNTGIIYSHTDPDNYEVIRVEMNAQDVKRWA